MTTKEAWLAFQSNIRHLPVAKQIKIQEAFNLAVKAHAGQKRMSGDPYVSHCIAVAGLLAGMGADDETIMAAMLHDAIEDTQLSFANIEKKFGRDVALLVDGVTKLKKEDVSGSPSLDEKIETIRKIFALMEHDVRIMVMKLADRLHNMQTIGFLPKPEQKIRARETIDLYVKIADRLCMRDIRDELEELCLSVLDQNGLAKLRSFRAQNELRGERVIGILGRDLRAAPAQVRADIIYEHKRWGALRRQMEAEGSTITGMAALNVVLLCDSPSYCYQILGALHRLWRRETYSFEDFINVPQMCGYQGLHTTIMMDDGTRVRCKIRTRDMHEYARKGVSLKCFDSKAMGVLQYVPWMEYISPLSADTSGRSEDFWESLQSDLLGGSITVHTADEHGVQLPEGSTALDGAFYCFGKRALRLKSIKIDGKDVRFSTPLSKGVSLDAEFRGGNTVSLKWLNWVNTGIAQAHIHAGLAAQPRDAKIRIGRDLLQGLMIERKRGLIEEFAEESFKEGIKSLGFNSLDDACVAIAEGGVEAVKVYGDIFESKRKKFASHKDKECYRLRFSMARHDFSGMHRLVDLHGKYDVKLKTVHVWSAPFTAFRRFTSVVFLFKDEVSKLKLDLAEAGAKEIVLRTKGERFWMLFGVPALSILWGLDNLLGKKLIIAGVLPYDLTFLRFIALFVVSLAYMAFDPNFMSRAMHFRWASPFNKHLFISGMAIFVTALSSYIAVQYISVVSYALSMNMGIAGILLYKNSRIRNRPVAFLITSAALIISTFAFLISETGTIFHYAFIAAIGCGVGFAIYSLASKRYQMEEAIQSRYPIFMLYLSVITLALSTPLAIVTGFPILGSPLFIPALLFVVFLTAVPYIVYFEILKYESIQMAWRYIPLFFVVVVAGEMLLYDDQNISLAIPLLIAGAWYISYRGIPQDT